MAYEPSGRSKPVAGAFIVKHGEAIPDDGLRMFYYQDGVRYIRGSKGPRRAVRQGPDGRAEEAAYKMSLDWAAKKTATEKYAAGAAVMSCGFAGFTPVQGPNPSTTVPALGVTVEPGPPVPTEDTVVLRMGRRTAEVLRKVLQYVGGPNDEESPRKRMDTVDQQLQAAGVGHPSGIHVAAAVGLSHKRAMGIRLRWPNGTPFAPPDVAEEKPSEKPSSYYHVTSTPVRTGGSFRPGDLVSYQGSKMMVIGGWIEGAADQRLVAEYGQDSTRRKGPDAVRLTDGRTTYTVDPAALTRVD
jgi:hypothetical protein